MAVRTALAFGDDGDDDVFRLFEYWTPRIVHSMKGRELRFEEIQEALGIPRNILTDRLKSLVQDGVLEKVRYSNAPKRYRYHLSASGEELAEILQALQAWNRKHRPEQP